MFENNKLVTSNAEFSFQIRVMSQQIELLTKVTKELKDKMDSMNHRIMELIIKKVMFEGVYKMIELILMSLLIITQM
jgi:hypothetical protein